MRYLVAFILIILSVSESHAELNLMPSALPKAKEKPAQEQQESQNWERLAKDREALEQARRSGDKAAIEAAEKKLKNDRDEIRKAYQKEEARSMPQKPEEQKKQRPQRRGAKPPAPENDSSRRQNDMQRESTEPYSTRFRY